jgi:hypothetical protein
VGVVQGACVGPYDAVDWVSRQWVKEHMSFDNIAVTMRTLFEMCTTEGYVPLPDRGSETCFGTPPDCRNPAPHSLSDFLSPLSHRWIVVMRNGIDAISPDMAMQRDYNPPAALYFIAFMLVGHLFVVNLFVGIILDNFTKVSHPRARVELHVKCVRDASSHTVV